MKKEINRVKNNSLMRRAELSGLPISTSSRALRMLLALIWVLVLPSAYSIVPAEGDLDTSFDPGIGEDRTVYAVVVLSLALQTDGKIIIGGVFETVGGVSRYRIARLNSDGTLDETFDPGAGVNGGVQGLALQTDGKILIGGEFATVGGVSRNGIARLNSDGTLDTAFDAGVGANNTVHGVALQSDGKILIGGALLPWEG